MSAKKEQTTALNQDEIANLAQQIWQTEGCQPGRDQEYWLKAEQQILAGSQQAKSETKKAGAKLNDSSAKGRSSARL